MRRIRIVGLCLVAVFALSAVVATAAQAEFPEKFPAFAKCVKAKVKGKGRFNDKNCQVPNMGGKASGGFELESAAGTALTSKTTASTLVTPGIGIVKCKAGTDTGEITGEQSGTDTVTFTSCEVFGKKCTSEGQKEGTIKTFVLDTTLGFINKEKGEVGVSLTGTGPGGLSAEFNCGGKFLVKTGGSVIGQVTKDVNVSSTSSTEIFKEVEGVQSPLSFEGGPEQRLETEFVTADPEVLFPSNETATATIKSKGAGEVVTKP